jgi:hypothetical protein
VHLQQTPSRINYRETPPSTKACAVHYCHNPLHAGIPRTLSECPTIWIDRVLTLEYSARRNVMLGVIFKALGQLIKQGRLRNRKLRIFALLFMKPLGAGSNTVPVIHKIMFLEGRENCWGRDVSACALSSLSLLSRANRYQVNCGLQLQNLSV